MDNWDRLNYTHTYITHIQLGYVMVQHYQLTCDGTTLYFNQNSWNSEYDKNVYATHFFVSNGIKWQHFIFNNACFECQQFYFWCEYVKYGQRKNKLRTKFSIKNSTLQINDIDYKINHYNQENYVFPRLCVHVCMCFEHLIIKMWIFEYHICECKKRYIID